MIFRHTVSVLFVFLAVCAARCEAAANAALDAGSYTIVCFGDSTTAPRPSQNVIVYACNMRTELPLAGIKGDVINKGVGGNTTQKAMERFANDVLAQNPDIVIIQFGINDSWVDGNSPAGMPRVSLSDYSANLTAMARALKEQPKKVRVIMMTPNTIGSRYDKWRSDRLAVYAQPCRDAAAAEGGACDVWAVFCL